MRSPVLWRVAPLLALAACGDREKTDGAATSAGGGGAGSTSSSGSDGGADEDPCRLGREEPEHVVDIRASLQTTIALSSRGRVYCWGTDDYDGCMGMGWPEGLFTPIHLDKLACIRALPEGDARFALGDNGDVWGWGTEFVDKLGDGEGYASSEEPTRALLPGPAEEMGIFRYTGLAWVDGAAWRWGLVWPEEFPDGPSQPVAYGGPTAIVHERLVCDLDAEGRLRCMGRNDAGEVGDGGTEPTTELVNIAPDVRFRQVLLAGYWVFGLSLDGRVFSWGRNTWGALGNGSGDEGPFPTPTEMPGLSDVLSVYSATNGGCTIDSSAQVRCWGNNTAESIAPGGYPQLVAIDVPDLGPALELAVAGDHCCSLKTDHTVWCRGARATRGAGPDAPNGGTALRVVFPFEEGE